MRIAVISDPHARLEATTTVFGEIDVAGVDEVWCLGDLVGYGNEPAAVVDLVRERCDLVLAGNHDLAVAGRLPEFLGSVPFWLRQTLERARQDLGNGQVEWLCSLEPLAEREGVGAWHASAGEPAMGAIDELASLRRHAELQRAPLGLVGHVHRPLSLCLSAPERSVLAPSNGQTLDLDGDRRWVVSPGTCGLRQRDGDPRPAWLLLDLAIGRAEFRRVEAR